MIQHCSDILSKAGAVGDGGCGTTLECNEEEESTTEEEVATEDECEKVSNAGGNNFLLEIQLLLKPVFILKSFLLKLLAKDEFSQPKKIWPPT